LAGFAAVALLKRFDGAARGGAMLRPRSLRSSALRRLLAVAATATLVGSVTQLASLPAAAADDCSSYPFRDPSLPMSARIDDLLGRLTLDEKISLLHQYQQPISR